MEKKERMPLWLAVAIVVVVSLPFGLWLKEFSLPLWIVFAVWAEYFAFGGSIKGVKTLFPAFISGVVVAVLVQALATLLDKAFGDAHLVTTGDLGIIVAYFIGFCVFIWMMKFFAVLQSGTLAYFQGIALTLGSIFTSQGAAWLGHPTNKYMLLIGSAILAVLAALLGCILGWINIWLNGVKEAPEQVAVEAAVEPAAQK